MHAPDVLLQDFAVAVRERRHADAGRALPELLAGAESAIFVRPAAASPDDASAFCTRFAEAWSAWLLADGLDPQALPMTELLGNLHVVHLLVQGSAAGQCDAAMQQLDARRQGRHDGFSATRLLLLWVPASRMPTDIFALHAALPALVTAQAVATVAAPVACTPEIHAARERAIAFLASGTADPAKYAPFAAGSDCGAAWMRCSYAPAADAHAVKAFLNRAIAPGDAESACLSPRPAADGRPLMLVPLDSFDSAHAMYRCYAPVIAACRAHFHLLALAPEGALDAPAAALFDEVLAVRDVAPRAGESRLAALVRAARERRPALVFYPSIGMRRLTLQLAQYRLTPVQAMSVGHPATSRSPQIDVLLLEEQWVVDAARYSERIVALPAGTLRFALPAGRARAAQRAQPADETVRIAVPSICQKWTLPFLQALARVASAAGAPLEFHFFSGVSGLGYPLAQRSVRQWLPQAVVHPALDYASYLEQLARCDLHAGTFPFGGTNSLIDSLLHGIPVVALQPQDARAAQDADFIARAGLPSWLVAADADEYVQVLVRLVNEPETRAGLRAQLADSARLSRIFLEGGRPEAFAAALHALLPAAAQASGERA